MIKLAFPVTVRFCQCPSVLTLTLIRKTRVVTLLVASLAVNHTLHSSFDERISVTRLWLHTIIVVTYFVSLHLSFAGIMLALSCFMSTGNMCVDS